MAAEFDVQAALEAFRKEAQVDRLAIQKTIQEGFDQLAADLHDSRITIGVLQDRQTLFGHVLWGLFITLVSVLLPIGYHMYAGSK